MKRIISVILALLMLFSVVACSGDKDPAGTGDDSQSNQVNIDLGGNQKEDGTEKAPEEILEVAQANYGKTITILQKTYMKSELYSQEIIGEVVPDAVYERNAAVEGWLGIKFAWKDVEHGPGKNGIRTALLASFQSQKEEYHIVGGYAYLEASYASDGTFIDINAIPQEINHLSLEKIWWNQSYQTEATVNNKMYFLVGDIVTSSVERLELFFYNQPLLETILEMENGEDFLQKVYDREWTYAYMLECIAKAGEGATNGGTWGATFVRNSTSIDGFLGALAINMVERSKRGTYTLGYGNDRALSIGNALRELYQTNRSVFSKENVTPSPQDEFVAGNSMFHGTMLGSGVSALAEVDWAYAIIPFPLWDADQEDYRVACHDEYTILGIPSNVHESLECVTAVLEVMGGSSYELVRPAMCEKVYKTRSLKTPAKAAMFDFIIAHTYFEFGYIYTAALGGESGPVYTFRDHVRFENSTSLAAFISEQGKQTTKALLDKLIESYYPQDAE